jgi:hypothetical protein
VPSGTAVPADVGPVIVYPQIYDLLAMALMVVLVFAAVLIALAWRLLWERRAQRLREDIAARYAEDSEPTARSKSAWLTAIARAEYFSGAVNRADLVLSLVVLTGLVLATIGLLDRVGLLLGGEPDRLLRLPRGSFAWAWTLSTWVVSFIPVAAMGLLRSAYKNPSLRRKVGILWDVGTFWPRAFHPLAPPSYGERAVPELDQRIRRITEKGGRVVVSAHSQGTALAVAAALQLERATLAKIALVTHGCPLVRLYARAFPAYFGREVLLDLRRQISWHNYYRLTDPIGGPVFGDEDDVRLPDPRTSSYYPGDALPPILGHSGYFDDEDIQACLRRLAAELSQDAGTAQERRDRADEAVPVEQGAVVMTAVEQDEVDSAGRRLGDPPALPGRDDLVVGTGKDEERT